MVLLVVNSDIQVFCSFESVQEKFNITKDILRNDMLYFLITQVHLDSRHCEISG